MQNDVKEFIEDLAGGVFEKKLCAALTEVAGGVIETGKKGKIKIELNFKRMSNGIQVTIDHEITYTKPTNNGQIQQKDITDTSMHVGKGGKLSLHPEDQGQLFPRPGRESNISTLKGA